MNPNIIYSPITQHVPGDGYVIGSVQSSSSVPQVLGPGLYPIGSFFEDFLRGLAVALVSLR